MKIASKQPKAVKSPVYITKEKLALWYAKPVMLGEIVKRGLYWYTEDGMRFATSRDALHYLIKIRDLIEQELDVHSKYVSKLGANVVNPVPLEKVTASPIEEASVNNRKKEESLLPAAPAQRSPTIRARRKSDKVQSTPDLDTLNALLNSLGYVRKETGKEKITHDTTSSSKQPSKEN